MVVLADAVTPRSDAQKLAQMLGVAYDADGFFSEAHPKLRPVETAVAGVYLAGACQGPKDIPESVAQASAAAAKVLGLFARPKLEREPIVARVNRTTCAHCRACINACPYKAIEDFNILDRSGKVLRVVANVNEGLCQGCGTCVSVCRSKSIDLDGFTDEQVYLQIAALEPEESGVKAQSFVLTACGACRRSSVESMEKTEAITENARAGFEPLIVAFVCNWCTYAGADLAGTSRLQYAPNVRIIKLPCTGRIDPLLVLKAFQGGADAVLVSGCHPGDCHYTSGNYHARRRWSVFRKLLAFAGIDGRRLYFSWVSAAEGQKFADLINSITKEVHAAGPFDRINPARRRT